MKEYVKRIALSACVMFTIFMAFWCLAALLFSGPEYGLIVTLSVLAASVAFAILRGIWFTDKVIRKLAYTLRIFGFGITSFFLLSLCAWIGSWFPLDDPWAWLTFASIFLAFLVIFCFAYQIHFKRTVGNFDAALQQYHERMGR